MTDCDRIDCTNAGTHHPVLLALPEGRPDYAGPPAEFTLGILACPEHQAGTTAADFISDEGWALIVAATEAVHKGRPERSTVGLVWRRPMPGTFPPRPT
jgi:hypothetical protein